MAQKIAIFSIHSDPLARLGSRENGGQNLYIKSLIQNLDNDGWEIDAFTRLNDRSKNVISRVGKRSRVIRLIGGPTIHIPKSELHPFFPEIYKNYIQFINGNCQYELFHGHHYDGGWMALKAHEQFGKPLLMTFHSLGKIRFRTQKNFLGKTTEENIMNERLSIEQELVAKSAKIISLSESEKNHLVKYYEATPDKIIVIPGGVNLEQFRNIPKNEARENIGIDKKDYLLLFVGRLEWRKGMATVIHALKIIRGTMPTSRLLIVGGKIFGRSTNPQDKKEYERLQKIAKEHGVENYVKFTGAVGHTDLPKYYSAADVLVVPSYYEPFGLVALEGLASKVPVIASRVGGLQTTIRDGNNGLLFEPRNSSDLAKKIETIYKNADVTKIFIKNGYEDVKKNYSWKMIVDQIEIVYESFMKKDDKKQLSEHENSLSVAA